MKPEWCLVPREVNRQFLGIHTVTAFSEAFLARYAQCIVLACQALSQFPLRYFLHNTVVCGLQGASLQGNNSCKLYSTATLHFVAS